MAALLSRVRLKFWENEGLAANSLFLGQAHSPQRQMLAALRVKTLVCHGHSVRTLHLLLRSEYYLAIHALTPLRDEFWKYRLAGTLPSNSVKIQRQGRSHPFTELLISYSCVSCSDHNACMIVIFTSLHLISQQCKVDWCSNVELAASVPSAHKFVEARIGHTITEQTPREKCFFWAINNNAYLILTCSFQASLSIRSPLIFYTEKSEVQRSKGS